MTIGQDDKRLLRALRGGQCERPPFWLMRQAGRYLPEYRELRAAAGGFLDLCLTPDLAVEVTLQPIRRFAMDAAILFSDILVIPYALGQTVAFEEGRGPVLAPVRTAGELSRLSNAALHDRLAPVYETLRRLTQALPSETTLIGFAGAPWTVATYMIEGGTSKDFATIKKWAYAEPESFSRLIELLVDATADYLGRQIEAGAEAVQIFDSWVGVLPETELRRWGLQPVREIVRRLKAAHPDTPVILFPRGAGLLYEAYAAESGADALSLDTAVPLGWARSSLQDRCALQGNLDPIMLVAGGAALEREAGRILRTLAAGPFIFNLGHGIVPQTPPEHVAQLAEIIKGWKS